MFCDSELAEGSLEERFPNHGEGNWDAGPKPHTLGVEAPRLGVCSLGLRGRESGRNTRRAERPFHGTNSLMTDNFEWPINFEGFFYRSLEVMPVSAAV